MFVAQTLLILTTWITGSSSLWCYHTSHGTGYDLLVEQLYGTHDSAHPNPCIACGHKQDTAIADCYYNPPCKNDYHHSCHGTTTTTTAADCRSENFTYSIRFCLTSAAASDFTDFDLDSDGMWSKVSDNFVEHVFICRSDGCNSVGNENANILLILVIMLLPMFVMVLLRI